MRVFVILFLLGAVGGCSSGVGEFDGGVPEEIGEFATDFAEKVCGVYSQCGCEPEYDLAYCVFRVSLGAGEYFTSGWREKDRFNLGCKDAVLNAVEAFGCGLHLVDYERIGVGGDCGDYCSLHLGGGQVGDACQGGEFYLYPVSDCRGNLVCDGSGTCVEACGAWFSEELGIGGQCEDGFLKIADCAENLICDTTGTDLCIPLPGEGQTCVYDNCREGLWCEIIISTKTCRAKVEDGESCRKNEACWSGSCVGNVCVGGEAPEAFVCEWVEALVGEPVGCKQDADCDDGSFCNGEDKCIDGECVAGEPPADGTFCGDGLVCRGGECVEPVCGNQIIEGDEVCDDGNELGEDGCSSNCEIESGWSCEGSPSVCAWACEDAARAFDQEGTFTIWVAAGCRVKAEVWGGGGGGGGSSTVSDSGGGGGGGSSRVEDATGILVLAGGGGGGGAGRDSGLGGGGGGAGYADADLIFPDMTEITIVVGGGGKPGCLDVSGDGGGPEGGAGSDCSGGDSEYGGGGGRVKGCGDPGDSTYGGGGGGCGTSSYGGGGGGDRGAGCDGISEFGGDGGCYEGSGDDGGGGGGGGGIGTVFQIGETGLAGAQGGAGGAAANGGPGSGGVGSGACEGGEGGVGRVVLSPIP